jgi:hypothetical protein
MSFTIIAHTVYKTISHYKIINATFVLPHTTPSMLLSNKHTAYHSVYVDLNGTERNNRLDPFRAN